MADFYLRKPVKEVYAKVSPAVRPKLRALRRLAFATRRFSRGRFLLLIETIATDLERILFRQGEAAFLLIYEPALLILLDLSDQAISFEPSQPCKGGSLQLTLLGQNWLG